jgi:histone H3/H4
MDDADAALPRTTVLKLAREALPADVRISVETQDVLLECSSEFVKLLATQANEVWSDFRKFVSYAQVVGREYLATCFTLGIAF